ncbi:diguanylate cyclase/phosphodiesterase [Jannaschia sp. CCS1]|nr:diguanylate cyclase/phosphodiesterase [Jannaschia sp. CCS1]
MGHHSKKNQSTGPVSIDVPMVGDPAHVLRGLLTAQVGIVCLSDSGDISFVSREFLAAFGQQSLDPGTVIGQPYQAVFDAALEPYDISETRKTALATGLAVSKTQPDVAWSSNPAGGSIGILTGSATELSQSAPMFEPDELTGLGNRKYLKACFEAIAQEDSGAIALFLDLDHFKQVNDTLGHAIGDKLLCKVADRLRKSVREGDIVVRIGGDEFAILLINWDQSAAEDVAARIIKVIGRPFLIEGHQVTIGVSIGMAVRLPNERESEKLLQRADVALYESKRLGRNRFHWFKDAMLIELQQRRDTEIDLRKAVLLGQFGVVFQPQMNFQDQDITGFEALVRWNHPLRGVIAPIEFIEIAEETGLIVEIGTWVLAEACQAAAGWPEDIAVAVNISPVQFEDEGFMVSVQTALQKSKLQPHRLELEITEATLLSNEEAVLARMNELQGLGIKISLDDFGIGYSSLNYLRKYPFDKVKIDQSFVREPFADESSHQIVEAVAHLGSALGMTVLAEGVETHEQMERIRSKGCASIQGYLVGRPIPLDDITSFLTSLPNEIGGRKPLPAIQGDTT